MGTLVNIEGSIESARSTCDVSIVDERKIHQVLSELDRYQLVMDALQETRWFGRAMYRIGSSVVLQLAGMFLK